MDDLGHIGMTAAVGVDEHKLLSVGKEHPALWSNSFVDVVDWAEWLTPDVVAPAHGNHGGCRLAAG